MVVMGRAISTCMFFLWTGALIYLMVQPEPLGGISWAHMFRYIHICALLSGASMFAAVFAWRR